MTDGLRLVVYDRTCRRRGVGMSTAWAAGAILYWRRGLVDASFGAASWDEALAWVAAVEPARSVREIQFWGHGRWGRALVGDEPLDAAALAPAHRLAARLAAVRERLAPGGEALVWLRTCEAFGAQRGLDFAARLADFFGARVAGHTYVIGALQSGLHGLWPGHSPRWSATEGLARGTADAPLRARQSLPGCPRTITCFDDVVPTDWFD